MTLWNRKSRNQFPASRATNLSHLGQRWCRPIHRTFLRLASSAVRERFPHGIESGPFTARTWNEATFVRRARGGQLGGPGYSENDEDTWGTPTLGPFLRKEQSYASKALVNPTGPIRTSTRQPTIAAAAVDHSSHRSHQVPSLVPSWEQTALSLIARASLATRGASEL